MLKTDRPLYKVILIFNLLVIVVGIALCLFSIFSPDANALMIAVRVLAIIALLIGAFYIIKGYSKDSAKWYKVFGAAFAAEQIANIVSSNANGVTTLSMLCICFSLTIILVLLLSLNLGESKSLLLCSALFALKVASLMSTLFRGDPLLIVIIRKLVDVDLACLYGIMTYAKYLDKDVRGTK